MSVAETPKTTAEQNAAADEKLEQPVDVKPKVKELGGPKGREPTRYGDWEKNGRCIDF